MATFPRKIQDQAVDTLEKCSSARSRAGNVVERVGKMVSGNVPRKVIALQLTENSRTGTTYDVEAVDVLYNVWKDSRSGTLITAKQTTALIEDAREVARNDDWDSEMAPSEC